MGHAHTTGVLHWSRITKVIDPIEITGMTSVQISQYKEAERLISQWREIGKSASKLLYSAREGIAGIDWFDHRHHLLNPPVEFLDFCMISGTNVVSRIPIDGAVLDLCCGDGFYDYYFYRHKAKHILGIDINPRAIALAKREHAAPNIEYILGDVMSYPITSGKYDTVICRGAIEHFTENEQSILMGRISDALKSGGWFCGDTVTPQGDNEAHKHEWTCEGDMIEVLKTTFHNIQTSTVISRERTTLLWRCQNK